MAYLVNELIGLKLFSCTRESCNSTAPEGRVHWGGNADLARRRPCLVPEDLASLLEDLAWLPKNPATFLCHVEDLVNGL